MNPPAAIENAAKKAASLADELSSSSIRPTVDAAQPNQQLGNISKNLQPSKQLPKQTFGPSPSINALNVMPSAWAKRLGAKRVKALKKEFSLRLKK